MTIKATVNDIRNRQVMVTYCEKIECESCVGCSKNLKKMERSISALNIKDLPIERGDTVEIFVSPAKAIKAAFLIFILPLALFFVMYAIGLTLLKITGETVKALFGATGIVIGFIINYMAKARSKGNDLPEIVRIIP